MENFVNFRNQLEDVNTDITPDMDYVDTDFGIPCSRDNSNDDR
jgi:hypothetical protein